MKFETRERVERYWTRTLGVPFDDAPVRVIAHREQLAQYPGIIALQRHCRLTISAPPAVVDQVRDLRPTVAFFTDPMWWRREFPSWRVIGPSHHLFLDRDDAVPVTRVRRAAVDDLSALRGRVAADEWAEAGFDDDLCQLWVRTGAARDIVAAANLTPFDGQPLDIGVVVAADARGHGYGREVSSAAVRAALKVGGVARWKARADNLASTAIAAGFGFELDAIQMTLLPTQC